MTLNPALRSFCGSLLIAGGVMVSAGGTRAQGVDWNAVTGAPAALQHWEAGVGASVDTSQSVEGGSSLRLDAPSPDAFPSDGNSLRFQVEGPGQLSFQWKSWLEGRITGGFAFVDDMGRVQGLMLAEIGARQGWQQATAFVPPGRHLMQWRVYGGGLAQPNAVWVDAVRLEPVPEVPLGEAGDTEAVKLEASGWQGLRHHTAFDRTDALFAGTAAGNFLRASVTGPGWLEFARWPSRFSTGWEQERLFLQPGLQQIEWQFPAEFVNAGTAVAIDALRFAAQPQVPLAEASDFPGAWTGSAIGVPDDSPNVVGGSAVMLGRASLDVEGPGTLRFTTKGLVDVKIGALTVPVGSVGSWAEHLYEVPSGPQTITWGGGDEIVPEILLDNVRFSNTQPVTLAEAMDTGLPVTTTGGIGVADAALAHDGVDCAVLRTAGEIRIPVTGPGRLTAWVYACEVHLDGVRLFQAISGWQFLSLDLDDRPHTVTFPATQWWQVDRRIDEVTWQAGAAARYADQLGSSPSGLWATLSPAPPSVVTEGADRVLVSGLPAGADLLMYSHATVPWRAELDVFSTAGLSGTFQTQAFTPDSFAFLPLQPNEWATTSAYVTTPTAPNIPWLSISLAADRPDALWKIRKPRAQLPTQPGGVSLAEALDSPFNWSAPGTTWTAYGSAPWFGGGDAVFGAAPTNPLTATLTGPGFARFHYRGGPVVKLNGTNMPWLNPGYGTYVSFVPEGGHVMEITSNLALVADAFTLVPPDWATLNAIECTGSTVAQPPGNPVIEVLGADQAFDGVDALQLKTGNALFAKADAPGFITWRARTHPSFPWHVRTVEATPGAMITWITSMTVHVPTMPIDEVRALPRVPVAVADAADFDTLPLTATPAGSWSGFEGAVMGMTDDDGVSLAARPSSPATLGVALPQAGVLSWWWRRDLGGTLNHPSGSTVTNGIDVWSQPRWEFAYLHATAARTANWQASGPPGSVWLDALAWRPGPPGPVQDGMDMPGLTFTSSNSSWNTVPMQGARDGDIAFSNSSSSTLQTTVTGPAFVSWSVMSRSAGGLTFSVNGAALGTTGAEAGAGWVRQSAPLGEGTHTLSWKPTNSVSGDRFFLDDFTIAPITVPGSAELADALDQPAQPFSSEGLVVPLGASDSHDGNDSLSLTPHGVLRTTAARGQRVRFWWRAPAGVFAENDGGRFLIDGIEVARLRPGAGWTAFDFDLPGSGPAQLQWSAGTTSIQLDELALTPLPPPSATAAAAAGWDEAGWLGNPARGGGGWTASSALSVDGLAALSVAPAELELDVTGPGWLHFDYAAAGLDVEVDSVAVLALKRSGAVTEAAADAWLRRGFRTEAVAIAAGRHRVRISAGGYAVVDRLRLLPALEPGILHEAPSPGAWTSMLSPGTLQVTASGETSDWTLRVSGPGLLALDWNTAPRNGEPFVELLLDGDRLHQLQSTVSTPWGLKTDIPPGLHSLTFRVPPVRPLQLMNVTLTPGTQPLAVAAASHPELRWSNAGKPWQTTADGLVAPTSRPTESELTALVPGLSFVSWPAETMPAVARLQPGFPVRPALGLGDRRGFLLDRPDPWALTWSPGSGVGPQIVRNVQPIPLTEVTPEDALELAGNWSLSLPEDGKWHALKGPPGTLESCVDGDALVTSVRDDETPSTAMAVIEGPVRSVFTWSAPEGLAGYGAGEFLRAGVPLLQYGPKSVTSRGTVTAAEHCFLEFPSGRHECGWRGWRGHSLAIDNFGPASGPRLADVLEAPGLPWAVTAPTRDLSNLIELEDGEDVLRVENAPATETFGQVSTQVVGPAVLRCRLRSLGVVEVTVGSRRFELPAADWRDQSVVIEDQGLTRVSFAPADNSVLWLDAVRVDTPKPFPVAATPSQAADAALLNWDWAPGWAPANNPVVALDETGYAEGSFTSATEPAATLRVTGPGFLSFRATSASDITVKMGASTLMNIRGPIVYWTSFLHQVEEGTHTITFATKGLFRLDAVSWTPALPPMTGDTALTDTDHDGVPLLLEFASGLSDTAPDASTFSAGASSGLPRVHRSPAPGDTRLRVEYLHRHTGVNYFPEFADTLTGPWQPAPASSINLLDSLNGLWSRYEAVDPAPPGRRSRFARVRVVVAP